MTERTAFGAELRRERERRGLTLEAIAEQTKVSAAHFAGLERADLSRWPSGIFRRAFVRSYALAVGLDPEQTVARFSSLFPDPSGEHAAASTSSRSERAAAPPAPLAAPPAEDEPGLRLALEQPRPPGVPGGSRVVRRLLAGVLDISVATLPAALVALVAGVHWFWPVVACVAMAGHLACFASLGTTPGAWLMTRLTGPPRADAAAPAERRRADSDIPAATHRRVTRQAASRPAQHAHRTRH
jgi:transcriptional regulator with XRE-family HTH domain